MSRFFRENILGVVLVGLVVGTVSAWVYDNYLKTEKQSPMRGTTIEEKIAPSAPRIWAV